MPPLRVQAVGVRRGQEHDVPPVRFALRTFRAEAGDPVSPKRRANRGGVPASDSSLLQKFQGVWNKHHNSEIECFDCKAKHEVSSAATSSFCPKCSTHVDLRNYKITTSFSRSIKTQGEIHITPKGDLSSTTVTCRSALIEGKMRAT
jgi:hypothetical protein